MKFRSIVSVVVALAALAAVAAPAGAGLPAGRVQLWAPENAASTHRPTLDQAVQAATQFDVITPLKGTYRKYVPEMKAANPDLLLLAYMNGTLAQSSEGEVFPDEWYLKDAVGAPVASGRWGNWLMNPNHEGWIANRIQQAQEFLAYSGYDGVLMDVMGTAPIDEDYSSGAPINPATGQVWTKAEWLKTTSALAGRVKAAIAPKSVFVNGLGSGARYFNPGASSSQLLDGIDGGHAEAFLRNAGEPIGRYPTLKNWLKEIDMLVDASARGKSVLTQTKVWSGGTQQEKDAWHRYALASFLLGAGERTYFTFFYAREDDPTVALPLWATNVGDPEGGYLARPDGVYQRNFAHGISLVNPGTQTVTIPLGGTYRALEGNLVSTITLAPNEGNVLVRVP